MVRADDEPAPAAGNRVLGHHPLAGLDVAEHEVALGVVGEREAGGDDAVERRVARGPDVDGQHDVGLDRVEDELGGVLVLLPAVGEAYGDEARLAPRVAQRLPAGGDPAEGPGGRRVHTAADPEHERAGAGGDQQVGEETGAAPGLRGDLECRGHAELPRDEPLLLIHLGLVGGGVCHGRLLLGSAAVAEPSPGTGPVSPT